MPHPNVFIKLTPEERQRVSNRIQRLVIDGQFRRCKPLQALYLSDRGQTFSQISKTLNVTYRVVQMWVAKYRKDGIKWFVER